MIGPVGTGGVAGGKPVPMVTSGVEVPPLLTTPDTKAAVSRTDAGKPPVDAARVAELRAKIADGSYRIDSAKIAERMVASDLPNE